MAFVVSVFLTLFVIITTIYFKWMYSYWKRRNVPQVPPSFPLGNALNPFTRTLSNGELLSGVYKTFKERGAKHVGVYFIAAPNYVPIAPEVIKNIMQKDFSHFVDRGLYCNEKDDPLSGNLFLIGGQKWRNLRTKLTLTFTSGKMKMMFETLVECIYPMDSAITSYCTSKEPVDIKDTLARFTTDVIGSCAFGLECNSFKTEDAAFRNHGQIIFSPETKFKALIGLFAMITPKWANILGVSVFPKESSSFFLNVVKDTVNYRRENRVHRKDMLQIVMDLQEAGVKSLTIEEIAAQAFVFFLAGFETSSTAMTFCLYELAIHSDLQEKVREEINCVLEEHDGKLTYEAIMGMKYMTQVIDETLRKYPPASLLSRQCVEDYLEPITGVTIEKGTNVVIPLWGLHMDPEYFPDPEKFDPDRFSDGNKRNIVPFTYMPFGEGPRICIGMRFGMMQIKVGLTHLLKNYSFTLSPKTKIPFTWDKYSFILSTEDPIWLDVDKL